MGIALLGPLALDGDAGPLRRQDRVVLTVLAIRPGDVVSAERIADALWGDSPPGTWSKVVQGCVVRLRKALGPGSIETTPHGYRLTLRSDELDTRRFEQLVGRGRELLTLSEPERAAYLLDEALALWRGPALAELDGWDAGRTERARLDEIRLEAEELGIDAALRAGRCREVLGRAQVLVAAEPLRERRWSLLATAQYQAGQQAQALRTLRQVRAVLSRELGLDPGPELVALEQAILRQDPTLVVDTALPEPSATCPYPGLVPYGVADGEIFFGRETEVADGLRRLADHGVLAVVGPSGSGKSSLVRAGVAASLERDGRRVVVVTPGLHPEDALSGVPTTGPAPVLVVDQCEEAFSVCESAEERSRFFDALVTHARGAPLVVALRADRLGELSAYPAFTRLVEPGLFLLGPMGTDQLRACIEGPAREAGLLLEHGLVDLLVREVEGEPGALPLLSHALRETWLHREGRTLTVGGYQASGGIRGAVARSAEQVYDATPDDQKPVLRQLMMRLVAPSGPDETARSRTPSRLVTGDPRLTAVAERLVDARLLTSDDGVLEIAHEALLRAWPRFRQWLEDDVAGQRILVHLAQAAATWDEMGRPESELYRGVRLAQAVDWNETAHPTLTPQEQEFLAASRQQVDAELSAARRHAEVERQARHRTRRLAAALAAALALALVAAAGATWYQRAASDRAAEAAAASTDADANRLAALSRSVNALDLSLLLAAEALRTSDTPATRDGLLTSLVQHARATQVLRIDRPSTDAVLVGDGRTLVLGMLSEVLAWHVGGTDPPASVLSWGHRYDFIAPAPDADRFAVWSWKDDKTLRIGVFDSTGRRHLLLQGDDEIGGWPKGLAFRRHGTRLLTSVLSGDDPGVRRLRAREYDVATGRLLRTVLVQRTSTPGAWPTAAISDDGSTVVSWAQDRPGPARVLDVRTGQVHRVRVERRDAEANRFFAVPGGAVQAWSDGALSRYGPDGRLRQVLQLHSALVSDVAVSVAGGWVATADESGRVIIWDVDPRTGDWNPRESLAGHDGNVVAVAADPSGQTLVTVSQDGTAIVWDLSAGAGLGTTLTGLHDRWISNRPAELVPGEVVVAPTRHAPGPAGPWWQQTHVAATFLDPRSGRVLDQVPAGDNLFGTLFGSSVSVSPDRSLVAVTYGVGTAILDARTHRVVARIRLPEIDAFGDKIHEPVWCSAWTPDGSRLLLCADGSEFDATDGNLVVVDTATWKVLPERVDIGGAAQTLEVSPDGQLLAVGMIIADVDNAPPGTVKLLDARTLRPVGELRMGSGDFSYDLSFSPDGTKLAVALRTGTVWAFDVATRRALHRPGRVSIGSTLQVEWLPDNRTVVATGTDSKVTLYDVRRGLVRATLPATTDGSTGNTYLLSLDAEELTAMSGTSPARQYPLDPRRWLAYACVVVGRDLTRDEWSSYVPTRPYRHTCGDLLSGSS